ncbi:MAG: Uma2 family endonuclease [Campylobacterales bacterium]
MSVPQNLLPNYNYADYEMWDGDWELIEGIPYAMAPKPMRRHQSLLGLISMELINLFDKCDVYVAVDWKVSSKTVVAPDVALSCGDDVDERFLTYPPKILFEILSDSTERKDRNLKFALYEEQKVPYYIMVEPKTMYAEVYTLEGEKYEFVEEFCKGAFEFSVDGCIREFDFDRVFRRVK